MNLKLMLEALGKRYSQKTAIIFGKRRLSYGDLEESSNRLANALQELGVGRGDRVAVLLTNSPELVICYIGIIKIGGIAVLLDTKYKASELASLFNQCQPKVLVSDDTFLEPLVSTLSQCSSIQQIINVGSGYENQFLSYGRIMANGSAQRVEREVAPDDIAHIAYTSGPSCRPKGVMISHQDLVVSANKSGDFFGQTDKDIAVLFALPLHHAFGLVVVLLGALAKGGTVAIMPGLSISSLTELVEREKATIFWGVPFVFGLLIRFAEEEGLDHDLSSLRLCVSAGATLPLITRERFKRCYGRDIVEFWGLTESVSCVNSQPIDGGGKPGSVGKPLPGYTVKVVDGNGREVLPNQAGEVIVRGLMMKGYYSEPKGTARAIGDGWLYTGDIGRIDEDGDLFLMGRKKEVIITKGQNVYPSDVEDVLKTHPKVAEAAVVGVPDETRGEVVRAVISLKKGQSITNRGMIRFCQKHLANYKLPKQIIFLDSLPKTAAGELHKEKLKALSYNEAYSVPKLG